MTDTNPAAGAELIAAPTPPLPADEMVSYDAAPAARRAEIDQAMAEIDLSDSNSVLFFGTRAQEEVTTVADEMLEGVRNKDTGVAGQALNEMVTTLRGFSAGDLDPLKKRGLLARLFGRRRPVA
jgi:uncharacterized protein YaaN involved in tellurite resistance